MVLVYFSALPYSFDIEPLDARGVAASFLIKERHYYYSIIYLQ